MTEPETAPGAAPAGQLLIVTAVPAEAAAVRAGLPAGSSGPSPGLVSVVPVSVVPVGVGPAMAAARTARLLALAEAAGTPYRAVISTGIAGGFTDRVALGGVAVATRSVAADLGAESPAGFLPVEQLGMPPADLGGPVSVAADPVLLAALRAALPEAATGSVLTVGTVTGSAGTARAHLERYPDAVAEAMEGYGVGTAATQAGLPFVEVRAISNPVGPRDRAAWRLDTAFATLTAIAAALAAAPDPCR